MNEMKPAETSRPARSWRVILQLGASVLLLVLVLVFIDEEALLERLLALDAFWIGCALIISVPQYVLSAARWQVTSERLGAPLPFRMALPEYYLAVLANQILPGGVMGDAARAIRHGYRLSSDDAPSCFGPALRAVVYERASGQVALFLLMLASLAFWPVVFPMRPIFSFYALAAFAVASTFGLGVFWGLTRPKYRHSASIYLREIHHALFARDVILSQLAYSFGVLATYMACFYCAGRAVGIALTPAEIITLVPVVLFSMTVPITISGWGVREATAAFVWSLAMLSSADGVAISVTYGLIVFISSLPGIFFLLPGPRKHDIRNQG